MGPMNASAPVAGVVPSPDHRVDVPLQGPEVAVRCPVRAELDHAPALERLRRPRPLVQTLRGRSAEEFRRSILREVVESDARVVVVIDTPDGPTELAAAEQATVAAIETGARVVVGPALPPDVAGRRLSQPDMIVRSPWSDDRDPRPGWLPVIIKHHRLTRDQDPGSEVSCSALDDLDPSRAEVASRTAWRSGPLGDDSLRLAHHWRALEARGLTPEGCSPTGAVIDKDRMAWWVPLDEARWTHQRSVDQVSALDRYDRRFSVRIDVIANRLRRNQDPTLDRIGSPVRISECDECPWFEVCNAELEAADHVSLVPGFRYGHAVEHQARGISTRTDLARLDWRTAAVAFGPSHGAETVDLADLRSAVADHLPTRALADALGPDHPALARLADHGLRTVADLLDLDALTASYSGAAVGHLPSAIDQARAAVSHQVFRARDCDEVVVPRADVEVDVDMENVDAGVYLWGTYTTRRGGALSAPDLRDLDDGYRPFLSWEPIDAARSATVFADFWRWLDEIRRRTVAAGCSFAAYCYTSAEHDKMRQILAATPDHPRLPTLAAVEALVRSQEWVDLYQVVRASIITGGRLGLKRVAPLAGFAWRDADPGGEQSMYWHERAVSDPDPAVRAEHRRRILAYNEDDVRATLALRTWLAETDLPPVESWNRHRR